MGKSNRKFGAATVRRADGSLETNRQDKARVSLGWNIFEVKDSSGELGECV